jgi:hypothetical protein
LDWLGCLELVEDANFIISEWFPLPEQSDPFPFNPCIMVVKSVEYDFKALDAIFKMLVNLYESFTS